MMTGDNGNNKLAAIYARVSSEDQAKGYSLPTQVEECLALAKREGYTVPEGYIFQEDITGTTLERPDLRKIRELARSGAVSAVIVHDPDRLVRKLGYQILLDEEMERAGVRLLFVLHQRDCSPEGMLFFHLRGAFSEYERAKILERTRRGKIGRAKAGQHGGGQIPLGYNYIAEPHRGRLEINLEESAIVQRVFSLCLGGKSTRTIAQELTRERIPTKIDRQGSNKGKRKLAGAGEWSSTTICQILNYEGYTGRGYWDKRNRKGSVAKPREDWIPISIPSIISEEIFHAAQAQLTRNKTLAMRNCKRDYLLRGGRLLCGHCGRNLSGGTGSRGRRYYRCTSRGTFVEASRACGGGPNADKVEEQVWQAVERILQQPELIAQEVARQQEASGELRAEVEREMELIEASLGKCHKEEKRWAEAYAGEVISLAELKGYKAEIATRRGSLQAHKVELQARLESLAQATAKTESLVAYCERVRANLKSFSFEEKRLALEGLDIRVTWTRGQPLTIQGTIPLEGQIVPSASHY